MRTIVPANDYYVYLYLNPLNSMHPFYVGRGRGKRALHHLTEHKARNRHKASMIAKIRRETKNRDGLSYEDSCRIEMELIAAYGRADLGAGPLTNLTIGGDGVMGISLKTRQRMSLAKAGTIAAITLTGERIRVEPKDPRWLSGELVGHTKGRPCHENTRRRAHEVHAGKPQSAALIEKRAASLRGKPKSAAHLEALSAARRGKVMVRPKGGGYPFKVDINDPRLLTGDLVGVTAGRFWAHNPQTKTNRLISGDLPSGFARGRLL